MRTKSQILLDDRKIKFFPKHTSFVLIPYSGVQERSVRVILPVNCAFSTDYNDLVTFTEGF